MRTLGALVLLASLVKMSTNRLGADSWPRAYPAAIRLPAAEGMDSAKGGWACLGTVEPRKEGDGAPETRARSRGESGVMWSSSTHLGGGRWRSSSQVDLSQSRQFLS